MSNFETSNDLPDNRPIWKIPSNSSPDGLMGLLNYLDMHAIDSSHSKKPDLLSGI